MTKIQIRSSSVPLLLKCNAGVLIKARDPYRPKYKAQDIGSAVHEALHRWAEKNHVDLFDVAEIYGVPISDIKPLFYIGLNYLDSEEVDLSRCAFEAQYQANLTDEITLTGTIDLIEIADDYYHIRDYKTGQERNDEDQLKAYALIMHHCKHDKDNYFTTSIYLRHSTSSTFKYTQADLEQHKEKIIKAVTEPVGYNPGEHCMFCDKQLECNVKREYSRSSVTAMTTTEFSEITNETLGELIPKAREAREILDRFDTLVKERGKIDALKDDTGQLYRSIECKREHINTKVALEVLGDYLDEKDIKRFIKINKSNIAEIAKNKGLKIKDIIKEIKDNDGIYATKFYQFRKVKK